MQPSVMDQYPLLLQRFNPHPARRPDATTGHAVSLPAHFGGFNPHPARRPDATLRTLPGRRPCRCFNPHPARRPDATPGRRAPGRDCACFNPHPARRPDATPILGWTTSEIEVSILIQPEGRMQRGTQPFHDITHLVSILIQPEGRMQQRRANSNIRVKRVSILIQPEGRMQRYKIRTTVYNHDMFQSSSSQKAGCNLPLSFLALPGLWWFQSSSSQKAGCNLRNTAGMRRSSSWFQSSSSQKAGCNDYHVRLPEPTQRSFNPHPARRPDATAR